MGHEPGGCCGYYRMSQKKAFGSYEELLWYKYYMALCGKLVMPLDLQRKLNLARMVLIGAHAYLI